MQVTQCCYSERVGAENLRGCVGTPLRGRLAMSKRNSQRRQARHPSEKEIPLKYLCLVYGEEKKIGAMTV